MKVVAFSDLGILRFILPDEFPLRLVGSYEATCKEDKTKDCGF